MERRSPAPARAASGLTRALHLAFEWSLAGKAVFAALELLGGAMHFFFDAAEI